MALKGTTRRPWLEIRRSELEERYLRHQARTLQGLHQGPVRLVRDRIDSDSFYSDTLIRIQCDELSAAYELMYPRDEKVVTREIVQIAGMTGVAALFCDYGTVRGRKLVLPVPNGNPHDFSELLMENGFPCAVFSSHNTRHYLHFDGATGLNFAKHLKKIVHTSMRDKVDVFLEKYLPTKPPKRPAPHTR